MWQKSKLLLQHPLCERLGKQDVQHPSLDSPLEGKLSRWSCLSGTNQELKPLSGTSEKSRFWFGKTRSAQGTAARQEEVGGQLMKLLLVANCREASPVWRVVQDVINAPPL